MSYIMRLAIMVLVLLSISACNMQESVKIDENTQSTTSIQEIEKTERPTPPTTNTTPSPYATSIIKDTREGIIPVSLSIPSIALETTVEHVGLKENGEMNVTEGFDHVGWYEKGYRPGEPGSAVIGGHVDSRNGPAVFYDLNKLAVGDEIILRDKDGKELTFKVIHQEEYPWDQAPLKEIFGYSHSSSLNLITCTGTFDKETRNYDKRLVVYTELVSSNSNNVSNNSSDS